MTVTQKLVDAINTRKNLSYPQKGYLLFQDVKGDGRNIKSLYVITGDNGGVSYSELNASTPRKRCAKLRDFLISDFLALPDERYSADLENCGHEKPRFVARFCGEWLRASPHNMQVPACVTYDAAVAYCVNHHEEMTS